MIQTIDYFYDEQIRRYLLQIVRAFSGFQYKVTGRAGVNGGAPQFLTVPCRMASQNRQVGHILRNNSENTIMSVPMFTVWIKEMNPARDRTQNPSHVSVVHVQERAVDTQGNYTGEKGNGYTVERQMPHPLDITIQLDIWTSNEHQKHQLWEQIYMAFNVGFDIQSSENPLDWTSLTTMQMDTVQWSSRTIPIGTSDEIDVASFTFKLPVWITPPAKVKQSKLIHTIVTNILDGKLETEDNLDTGIENYVEGTLLSRQIVTPDNAQIQIDTITNSQGTRWIEAVLLGHSGNEKDENGEDYDWSKLIGQYGTLFENQSQLRLRADVDQELNLDVIGTISLDTVRKNVLLWQTDPDTLPGNTLAPVLALIDPVKHFPVTVGASNGILPAPAAGQRYLILGDLSGSTQAWGEIADINGDFADEQAQRFVRAFEGDILEYMPGGYWQVVFKAATTTATHYLVNQKSGKQFKFYDGSWILAIDGVYHPGFWRLKL